MIRALSTAFFLLLSIASPFAEPISSGAVSVIDGDTTRARDETIQLIGFDTSDATGSKCDFDRKLGERATARLQQLVSDGGLELYLVPCSCRPGTEGTEDCNRRRACGVLRSQGRDVGAILILGRLASRYVCGVTSCPRRESWCGRG
jgi:micrococcal nuclease